MRNHRASREQGFSLIELLITLSVLSFGLLGVAGLQIQMVRANAFNGDMTIATAIGADLMDEAKSTRLADLAASKTTVDNGWTFNGRQIYLTTGDAIADSVSYGDIDGDNSWDVGDLDIGLDGSVDDPYGGRYRWVRTLTPIADPPQVPNTFVSYRVDVTVFWPGPYESWPDPFSAYTGNPRQQTFTDVVP